MLGIELKAKLGDEIELGLQKVDVLLLIVHQLLEQVASHVVLDRVAMSRSFLVKRPRIQFGLQVALDHLLDGLPDMECFERLHIWSAVEEDDTFDGVKIFIVAAKKMPDGTLQAARVNYGKDGLTPPM
jgi:hypothetical protein